MGNKNCINQQKMPEPETVEFSQSSKLRLFKQNELLRYFNYLPAKDVQTLDQQLVDLNLHDLDYVFWSG